MHSNRAADWLAQAENDMAFARKACEDGFFAQTCFIAQQSAENTLKSVLLRQGSKAVFTHSLVKLCELLSLNGTLEEAAATLDLYYVSARYPDAFSEGAPFQNLKKHQATAALLAAQLFLDRAQDAL